MSPNPHNTPSNQSELKKIIDDVIPMCGVLDCEVCENRHIELAKRLESQRTEAQKQLLDELHEVVSPHSEGATREDLVSRSEHVANAVYDFIADKGQELSK